MTKKLATILRSKSSSKNLGTEVKNDPPREFVQMAPAEVCILHSAKNTTLFIINFSSFHRKMRWKLRLKIPQNLVIKKTGVRH